MNGRLTVGRKPGAYQARRVPNNISIRSAAPQVADTVLTISEDDGAAAAQQQQEQNIFHVDYANGKSGKPCLQGTGGGGGSLWRCLCGGTREMYLFIVFLCLLVAWLIVLTVLVARPPQTAAVLGAITPILERDESRHARFKFSFTLQPDEGSSRLQTLQITNPDDFNLEQVLVYEVCCFHTGLFVCRTMAGVKNIGIDAYFSGAKSLIVHIVHPEMVGAKCNLLWTRK